MFKGPSRLPRGAFSVEPAGARPTARTGGVALYSTGILFFACNDALAKWLMADYGAGELMALRSLGAALVLVAVGWRSRFDLRFRGSRRLHVLRVLLSAIDTFAFYYATKALPLADVMTLYAASPLLIVALSALVLGERLGPGRLVALAAGFAGVVIALHPTAAVVSPSALIALGGSGLFAATVTATRKLRDTHWLTLVTCQFVGSGVIGTVVALPAWVTPGAGDFGLLVLMGVVAVACYLAITKALAVTEASILAPLQYASIVWATLLGWLVWRDVPSASTVLGMVVIVASGLVVLRPERASARETEVA